MKVGCTGRMERHGRGIYRAGAGTAGHESKWQKVEVLSLMEPHYTRQRLP
jgi:hypothetical protein